MRRTLKISAAVLFAAAWALPALADAAPAPAPAPSGDDDVVIDDEMEDSAPAKPADDKGGASVSVDLFGDDKNAPAPGEKTEVNAAESEAQQLKEEKAFISVVQRQRFLKKKRFDVQPHFGITVNDPFVRHYVVGAELNYWLSNRMAVGFTGSGFIGNKTSRYNNIRAQEGLLLTANKTLWQASVNFLYNPFYGKIAVFNRALMHWEAYVQVGGGAIQTQVIPRFEALHEPFRTITGQGNFAVGSRFYIPSSDWVSFNIGVRTFVFPDKLEPGNRGPSTGSGGLGDDASLDDPAAAKAAADTSLSFNTVVFFGVSFYFPTTFEYTTRR